MNQALCAMFLCLLSQSLVRADEPATLRGPILSRAIAVEAKRLAESTEIQSTQPTGRVDQRSRCLRHGAACGALIGYAAGLTIGLAHPPEDFSNHRGGFAVGIMGPLGAVIGAAVGCCHH